MTVARGFGIVLLSSVLIGALGAGSDGCSES